MLIHKAKKTTNDWEVENLFGAVRSVETCTHKVKKDFGERPGPELIEYDTEYQEFDQKGNLKTWRHAFSKDTHPGSGTLTYNEQGQLMEKREYEKDQLVEKETYCYDEKGRVLSSEWRVYQSSVKSFKAYRVRHVYDYDFSEEPSFEWSPGAEEERIVLYDGDRVRKQITLDSSGVKAIVDNVYDENGRLSVQKVVSKRKGEDSVNRVYHYAKGGQLIELVTTTLDDNYCFHEQKAEYDQNDNQVAFEIRGEHENWDTSCVYDDRNNLLKRVHNGRPTHWQYEFDETGNWVRRMEIRDGQTIELVKRKVAYYP